MIKLKFRRKIPSENKEEVTGKGSPATSKTGQGGRFVESYPRPAHTKSVLQAMLLAERHALGLQLQRLTDELRLLGVVVHHDEISLAQVHEGDPAILPSVFSNCNDGHVVPAIPLYELDVIDPEREL